MTRQRRALLALLADRSMKARHPGQCPLCLAPIRVGQPISRAGQWAHTTCIIAARAPLASCPVLGCPVRYPRGEDRLCADHELEQADLPGPPRC